MKHQKWLSVLFVVLALVIVSVLALPAQAAEESDLTFTLNADGQSYSVTACNTSASGELVIPSTHEGKPVTAIGDKAFYECYGLSYISIPDTVTSIGMEAFAFCDLPELTIPSSVVSIGSSAFYGNNNLIYETFGNAKYLGNSENPYLALVQAEDTEIAECRILPETKIILGNAFYGCTYLSDVTYCGTQEQWDAIAVGNNNAPLTDAALRFHNYENGLCTVCQKSGTCGENLTWTLDTAGTLTISGTGAMTDYGYDNLPWAGMGEAIHSVVIESGVTTICYDAFAYCTSLQSITIPKGITTIGNNAFNNTSLQSITIPESVTTIGAYAFDNCTDLEEINFNATAMNDLGNDDNVFFNAGQDGSGITVNIGANVTRIPACLFYQNSYNSYINVKMVNFAAGSQCQSIGDNAFYGCTGLTSVTIGESVTTIGDSAFYGCTGLTSLTIGESVTTIGAHAFYDCTGLEEINFNATAMNDLGYDDNVFYNAGQDGSGITVNIGANVTRIPVRLFAYGEDGYYPPEITIVNFAENSVCEMIGQQAFYNCGNLRNVAIPASVSIIQMGAFGGCYNIDHVVYGGTEAQWDTLQELCFEGNLDLFDAFCHFEAEGTVFSVDNYCTQVCFCCSLCDEYYKKVWWGDHSYWYGVCSVCGSSEDWSYSFVNANNATITDYNGSGTNVVIPATVEGVPVTAIGGNAFSGCSSLRSVSIPDSVTAIGNSAFYGCTGLTSVTIGENVTSIGDSAFSKCSGLEEINFNAASVADLYLSAGVFVGAGQDGTGVTVNIGSNVTRIPAYLFSPYNYWDETARGKITNVVFSENSLCAEIGACAFRYCTDLQSIDIPGSVTSIGELAFDNCTNLKTAKVNAAVTELAYGVFKNCYSLQAVTLPDTLMSLGKDFFANCSSMQSITIPENVSTIGNYAFSGCSSLVSITVPEYLSSVSAGAFADCENLSHVFYGGTEDQWDSIFIDYVSNQALTEALRHYEADSSAITTRDAYCTYVCHYCSICNEEIARVESKTHDYVDGNCSRCGVSDDWIYEIVDSNNVTITDYNGDGGDVVIPSTLEGIPVTAIGEHAFSYITSLQSVVISDSVTTIGCQAFRYCDGLKSVTIGKGVTQIGAEAFVLCKYLEEINFNAAAMADFEYFDNVFASAGEYGTGITVKVGANVARIPARLFYVNGDGSPKITNVIFENGSVCESIGDNAFCGCTYLRSVTIGERVTTVEYGAFEGCTYLTEINFNAIAMDDLPSAPSAFLNAGQNTTGITLNIGAKVTRIPANIFSFYDTSMVPKIRKVVFAEGSVCTSIGACAFENCTSLESITIGEMVSTIGDSAFAGCSALQGIWVDENNLTYSSDAYGVLFNKNKTKLIQAPRGISGNYEIPGSVTSIADSAFAGCAKLKGVTVPSTVTEIAYYTFGRCTALENVSLPNTLQTLGDAAFYRCESLQSIDVPDSVKAIGNSAFSTCTSLQSIAVPDSVTALGDYVFSKCYGLKSVTIGEGVPAVGECAFYMCESLQELVLGSNVASIGSDAFYGNISLEEITIPGKVLTISSYMFSGCTSLRSVTLLNGLERIYSYAFSGCTELERISIPESIWYISDSAFDGCTALVFCEYGNGKYLGNSDNPYVYLYQAGSTNITEFNIHEDTKLIREDALAGCTQLRSLTIPEGVTDIGYLLAGCTALEHISIPDSLTYLYRDTLVNCVNLNFNEYEGAKYLGNSSNPYVYLYEVISTDITECTIHKDAKIIGDMAFFNCSELEIIEIPDGITSIGSETFYNCSSLQYVILPDGITSIGYAAFYNCSSLQTIIIPDSVTWIYDVSFYGCDKLNQIFYKGSLQQKNHVDILNDNWSTITPIEGEWHYGIQQIQFCGRDCYYCGHCRKSMTLLGEAVKATVIFQNWDGTTLDVGSYYWGELPIPFTKPTKVADDSCTYTFVGWDELVVPCIDNTTYTAEFVPVCKHYVVAFKDWDGRVISSVTYHYGDTVLVPAAPTRPADNQYTYTFSGWDSDIVSCAGNATYTATYTATDIDYTVAFMNWNGSVIDYGVYHYGDVLNFPVVPNRPSDNKYTYTFTGWDSTDTSCSGNAVYTAVFKQTEINYTVVFKDWNGNVLSTKIYHYGDKVSAPTAPTRAADHMYTYTFDGWDKAVVDCSGNATYTALYKSTYRSYTVTFKNWDGTILSTKTYNYGDTILAPSVPKRPSSSKYSYTYVGWDGVVGKCTGNATYTAVFTAQSLVPTTVTSTKHTVSGGTISKIGVGTTVSTLLGNLNENSYAKVYQGNNVVSGSALIGTGMEVKIMDGSTVKATATVVVTGDTNGDGKLTITDMLAAKSHLLKKNNLEGASSQAADTNGDGGISITDFIQMKAHILGKSIVEPQSTVTVRREVTLEPAEVVEAEPEAAMGAELQAEPETAMEEEAAPVVEPLDVMIPDKKLYAFA